MGEAVRPSELRVPRWSTQGVTEALQAIAEALTGLVGFEVATINVVDGDDLVVVATAGEGATALGVRRPRVDLSRRWRSTGELGVFRRVDEHQPGPEGRVWPAGTVLVAPIVDEAGQLRGVLGLASPRDGRLPEEGRARLLDEYAARASRIVLSALDQEELAERARLADVVADALRRTSEVDGDGDPLEAVVAAAAEPLLEAFAVDNVWGRLFPDDTGLPDKLVSVPPWHTPFDQRLLPLFVEIGQRLWTEGRAGAIGEHGLVHLDDSDAMRQARDWMLDAGFGSACVVPIGAGDRCLGLLALTRIVGGAGWTRAELEAAYDIGRDLGQVLLNVRAYRRQRETAAELQALDGYKSRLVAAVSHELKNPLTALLANLELLDDVPDRAGGAIATIERNARRMGRTVDDLLLLSRLSDPEVPTTRRPVDLAVLTHDAVALVETAAAQREVEIVTELDAASQAGRARLLGDRSELERMITLLVGRAVAVTHGGLVEVTLRRRGDELVLTVCDTGVGYTPEQAERLFTDFVRAGGPDAPRRTSGIALPLVAQIVRRHGGRVSADSDVEEGTTFTVVLPA